MQTGVMKNGKHFSPNSTNNRNWHMDKVGTATNIPKKTQKNPHITDNTIVQNNTHIVLGYLLKTPKIVSNPGSPWNVQLSIS